MYLPFCLNFVALMSWDKYKVKVPSYLEPQPRMLSTYLYGNSSMSKVLA